MADTYLCTNVYPNKPQILIMSLQLNALLSTLALKSLGLSLRLIFIKLFNNSEVNSVSCCDCRVDMVW